MNDDGFSLEEDNYDGRLVLRPVGELDVAAAPTMRARLVEILRATGEVLVVDCSALEFIDSSGLSVLAHAQRRIEESGGRLHLACVPERVGRVLELTGLTEVLPMYPTVQDALGGGA